MDPVHLQTSPISGSIPAAPDPRVAGILTRLNQTGIGGVGGLTGGTDYVVGQRPTPIPVDIPPIHPPQYPSPYPPHPTTGGVGEGGPSHGTIYGPFPGGGAPSGMPPNSIYGVDRAALIAALENRFPLPPGVNPEFWSRLSGLKDAISNLGGDFNIYSAMRDPQRQAQLYQAAVQHFQDEAAARKRVAPPGMSWHDPNAGNLYGLGPGAIAADISGRIDMAHELAKRFGLEFTPTHPWHVQLAGLK